MLLPVSTTPKPSLCCRTYCPRVKMEMSVDDPYFGKRSKTPSSGKCPGLWQWVGTSWSLRSLPTPSILGFYDSVMKAEVKNKKDNLGRSQRGEGGGSASQGWRLLLPLAAPMPAARRCPRRVSTQKLGGNTSLSAAPRAWLTPVSKPTKKGFWALSKKPQSCWLCMTSIVYDQKVKYSHNFFKSRILPCVFLRAESLFLFKTMNIKGRKEIF